jgi:hypothetical protein
MQVPDAQRARRVHPRRSDDPCRPQAQGDRCDRRSVRPVHPAGHSRIAVAGAKTAYIERGSPWENGYIESFNARLRDELLNGEIFYTLREAQIVIESWRRHYNTIRPHASIGYKPPAPEVFVPAFAAWPAALRRPAPPATLAQRRRSLVLTRRPILSPVRRSHLT